MSKPTLNRHVPPQYRYKRNGYNDLTMCTNYYAIGLYRDCSPSNPCYFCGYKSVESLAKGGKWIPPVYKGFWIFKKMIKKGYWELAE